MIKSFERSPSCFFSTAPARDRTEMSSGGKLTMFEINCELMSSAPRSLAIDVI